MAYVYTIHVSFKLYCIICLNLYNTLIYVITIYYLLCIIACYTYVKIESLQSYKDNIALYFVCQSLCSSINIDINLNTDSNTAQNRE